MPKKIFILGAGASTDFESIHYTLDLPGFSKESKVSTPLPVANNFFTVAIDKGVLKKTYYSGLWSFIQNEYSKTFDSLQNGDSLNIEQVYYDLDTQERKIQDWTKEKIELYLTKVGLIRIMEELLNRFVCENGICLNHKKLADYCVRTKSDIISFNWDTLIDDALFVTKSWYYENGYGIDFLRTYRDGQEFDHDSHISSCLLLKPHGSINWFKYRDFISGETEGFSSENVSDVERTDIGLFLFSLKRRNESECRSLRLGMGKNYNRPLKMPVEVDIVPPGEYIQEIRPKYQKINSAMRESIAEADKITIIGFALKDTDRDSRNIFKEGRHASRNKSIIIELVNKSKEDITEQRRLQEICSDVFAPCKIEFSYFSFKDYCSHII